MARRTVRVEALALMARVATLGQQSPASSAASASAISTSLGVDGTHCRQAQFMAAILMASA